MPKRTPSHDPIGSYLREIQRNLFSGIAREQTHRRALQNLLESLDLTIDAFNDPKHIDVGAPDFTIRRKGNAIDFPVGYVETKDIGEDLDKTEKSDQLKRYLGLPSVLLTDYLEFRWYADGKLRLSARLASLGPRGKLHTEPDGVAQVRDLLSEFLRHSMAQIVTPSELADRMAHLAHLIREVLLRAFEGEKESGHLHRQFQAFQETLIPDLKPDQFADMYAQTIAYGLFAARCQPKASAQSFSRASAADLLPKTNPFLRKLFQEIAFELEEGALPFVDDLVALLRTSDIGKIMADFGKRAAKEDPVVHFYEDFLKAYDPKVREMRGVYYTPEPVVSYIVRSVDHLLKTRFNKHMGLADKDVLILDPACGTGTFLYAVINHIHDALVKTGQKGQWNRYVSENLLKRVFGFELLMAPYAVAHLKLGLFLQELGYTFESDERLGIYLTNTLEDAIRKSQQVFAFADAITHEGEAAQRIKRDEKIMVVLGNPPYSGHSANRSWEMLPDPKTKKLKKFPTFIGKLLQDYYFVDGKPLGEKNPKWLQDDYVKFIRFGQWRIERTGYGILAFITNHGYLDNPTFRGMRQQLMNAFSQINILDLHGNAKKKETAPDGGKDENVFDIQQGVAIGLFAKEQEKANKTELSQADLYGLREAKYKALNATDIQNTAWAPLKSSLPNYLFIRQSDDLRKEYEEGWKLTDIFPVNSVGIVTARDSLTIHWTKKEAWETVQAFAALPEDEARQKYGLGRDAQDWKVKWAQEDIRASGPRESYIHPLLYRPFDIRFTYYTGASRGFICRPRTQVMRRMLPGTNIGLVVPKRVETEGPWRHVLVSPYLVEHVTVSLKTIDYLFPLFGYPTDERIPGLPFHSDSKTTNLGEEFVKNLNEQLGAKLPHSSPSKREATVNPRELFGYVYALLHSEKYRRRYEQFLKLDLPRIPLPTSRKLFSTLSTKGQDLINLHLLSHKALATRHTKYEHAGDDAIQRIRYVEPNPKAGIKSGRVYINEKQFFEGVPQDVWEFHIGGYQVCEKWLKDRKGRTLSSDDIDHYQKIVVAISETIRIMREIDDLIPGWPLP